MFYQLRETPVLKGLYMIKQPNLGPKVRWLSGLPHTVPIPTPLEIELKDEYGTVLADIIDSKPLLMSNKLIDGLRQAGVDNFDTYEAVLIDKKRNKKFKDYSAVQIIGRLKAVDMQASKFQDPTNAGHTIVEFEDIKLDEEKTHDLFMFRLHETVTTIVIHEKVKRVLENIDLKYVTIAPLGTKVIPALE
jgi:hypothetical protein